MKEEVKTVRANGLEFAYFEEGEGPLCVLLHGFPDTPHTWDAVRPALAEKGWRVVTPFLRGYHPTQIPSDGDYHSDTLGRDVAELIKALGEESAVVVGHDWGASAAYSVAGLFPERLRMLVTVAIPHPAGIKWSPGLIWAARHFFTLNFPGAARRARQNNFAEIDRLVRRWSPTWNVPSGETDAVKAVFRQPGALEAAIRYYHFLRPTPPPGQRHRVQCPSVAFAGLDDMVKPSAYEDARSCYEGDYEVVRVPGGHFMHREHPEPFIRELIRVLERART